MIYCVNHTTMEYFGGLLTSNFRLRYKMLVDAQYWDVGRFKGMEYDQYDTPAASHLVWTDDFGEVRGSVRTAPTDRPYMIKELWPQIVTGELPSSLSVWEASRFCVDHDLPSEVRQRVKAELVLAFLEFGLQNDVREMIGIMPEKFWKSCFINNGWPIEYIGPESDIGGGYKILAGRMPITLSVLQAVRKATGISTAVLATNPRQRLAYDSMRVSAKDGDEWKSNEQKAA
ncbi:MAG TPA: acyl-homoserine-lactone synthase [Patescibacteria group bacterium]|nr:acyl-homoserine-lactone synthase [Patescibacteria group bacterium]